MTSRTFTFNNGHVVTCDTAEHSYANGLETGRNWTDNYRPGGPWVPSENIRRLDTASQEWQAALAENNRQWLKGFDDGRSERKQV